MRKLELPFLLLGMAMLPSTVASAQEPPLKPSFQVTSPDYAEFAFLDKRSAASERDCGGKNLSPALEWSAAPAGTQSFAVYFQDPDGMKAQGESKWIGYNIPPTVHSLVEGAMSDKTPGVSIGLNDHGDLAYYGPCTPYGERHHYVYGVYALDIPLGSLKAGMNKTEFLQAIRGHVLATNSIVFVYQRRVPANGIMNNYVPKNKQTAPVQPPPAPGKP